MQKKLIAFLKSNQTLVSFFVLGIIALIASSSASTLPIENPQLVMDSKSADTFIPKGFVLVPIEIVNADSLSSLVGEVGGVVDLYIASVDGKKGGMKVGSRLKILRAPLNPQQYAVLVKDTESSRLLSQPGPFVAVVQNPTTLGPELTTMNSSKIKINYQN